MNRAACVLFLSALAVLGVSAQADDKYILGALGQSCTEACYGAGMNCNAHIVTNNSASIFTSLGVECTADPTPWWAEDQPSYAPATSGGGNCYGYTNVPAAVVCSGSFATTQRVCRCTAPSPTKSTFGTGLSGGAVTTTEQFIFNHHVAAGDIGVMTHYWTTYPSAADSGVLVRYYIDGEKEASIQFQPSLACGVGFFDAQAPWATKWFGKGSKNGGWHWNFRVPFHTSILISVQHLYGTFGGFYMIVRGATNVPVVVGDITLPTNGLRLQQFTTNKVVQPIEWVTLVDLPKGTAGMFWMHTLAVTSGNENFLEGCYHMYTPDTPDFPGVVLSTGTEDYYDSAWYFDAGEFHFPVSGYTHINFTAGVEWSAYRFHEMDPIIFHDGIQFVWRNGDTLDPAGLKCFCQNGTIVGTPTESAIKAYAWVYTYNPSTPAEQKVLTN